MRLATTLAACCLLAVAAAPAQAQHDHPPRTCGPDLLTITPADIAALARRGGSYTCDPVACRLPDCLCAATEPPGGLAPDQVPQFILLTWDDLQNAETYAVVAPVIDGLTNPDGAVAPATFYVNENWSDPAVIKRLYDAGHEIGNHTATHDTGDATTAAEWIEELAALTAFVVESGVDLDQVAGFRAPYLLPSEALWPVLQDAGLFYDSSIGEIAPSIVSTGLDSFVWPFTMDAGLPLPCFNGGCPAGPVPGLWEVPMWLPFNEEGGVEDVMDPGMDLAPEALYALLDYNFEQRYTGNRTPFGLYLHAWQMADPARQQTIHQFLADKLQEPDVWMITTRGLVEWMRDPVPADEIADWFAAGCHRGACSGATDTELAPEAAALVASVYPNPSAGTPTLEVAGLTGAPVTVEVYDVLGRRVWGWTEAGTAGTLRLPLPLDGLPAGPYVWRLRAGETVVQGRLTLL